MQQSISTIALQNYTKSLASLKFDVTAVYFWLRTADCLCRTGKNTVRVSKVRFRIIVRVSVRVGV